MGRQIFGELKGQSRFEAKYEMSGLFIPEVVM
jgi:hypothetical protein